MPNYSGQSYDTGTYRKPSQPGISVSEVAGLVVTESIRALSNTAQRLGGSVVQSLTSSRFLGNRNESRGSSLTLKDTSSSSLTGQVLNFDLVPTTPGKLVGTTGCSSFLKLDWTPTLTRLATLERTTRYQIARWLVRWERLLTSLSSTESVRTRSRNSSSTSTAMSVVKTPPRSG